MAFGFFHNIFEQASSAFRKAGKSAFEAGKFLRSYITDREKAETFIRRNREARVFYRAEPFIKQMPYSVKPTQAMFTPTSLMLGEKHQYLFRVKFRYTDRPLDEKQFVSFVTNEELTKREAEHRMGNILLKMRDGEKYPNLQSIEMELRGTRSTMWLP